MRRYKFDEQFTKYLVKKYKNNIIKAAEDIGCHPETLRRSCRRYGIPIPRGRKVRVKGEVRERYSKFGLWLKDHKEKLPKSYVEIAELSGCTYKTVWMYFYNRRKEAQRVIAQRPWAGDNKSITLETPDGTRIPVGAFARVSAYIEKPTGQIKLVVKTHTGQVYNFRYSPKELRKIFLA